MERIRKILDQGIESIYTNDHEIAEKSRGARSFERILGNELRALFISIRAVNVKLRASIYGSRGFFTLNGQMYYFSVSDLRHFPKDNILIRTARDYQDFTGGSNQYITLGKDSKAQLANLTGQERQSI